MTTSSIGETLKDIDLFKGLRAEELDRVAALARSAVVTSGVALINESERGDAIFLILEGRVDVKVSVPGSEAKETIATLNAGEVVGELMLVGKSRRSAYVYAKDEVNVMIWSKADLLALFEKEHHIGYRVMTNIAGFVADRLTSTNMVLRNVMSIPKASLL